MKTIHAVSPAHCNADECKSPSLTVGQFYKDHGEDLQMRLVGDDRGFDRKIPEPTINRPGLALTGFYQYFANKRIQVVGSAELAYLKSLSVAENVAPLPAAVYAADSLRGFFAQRGHPAGVV